MYIYIKHFFLFFQECVHNIKVTFSTNLSVVSFVQFTTPLTYRLCVKNTFICIHTFFNGHISLCRSGIKIIKISVQGQICHYVSNTNSLTDHIKMRNSAALLNTAHRSTLLIFVCLCRGHIYPHYHSGLFPIHLMTFSWSRRYAGHGEVQSAQTGLMLTEALSNSSKPHSLCSIPSQSPPKAN